MRSTTALLVFTSLILGFFNHSNAARAALAERGKESLLRSFCREVLEVSITYGVILITVVIFSKLQFTQQMVFDISKRLTLFRIFIFSLNIIIFTFILYFFNSNWILRSRWFLYLIEFSMFCNANIFFVTLAYLYYCIHAALSAKYEWSLDGVKGIWTSAYEKTTVSSLYTIFFKNTNVHPDKDIKRPKKEKQKDNAGSQKKTSRGKDGSQKEKPKDSSNPPQKKRPEGVDVSKKGDTNISDEEEPKSIATSKTGSEIGNSASDDGSETSASSSNSSRSQALKGKETSVSSDPSSEPQALQDKTLTSSDGLLKPVGLIEQEKKLNTQTLAQVYQKIEALSRKRIDSWMQRRKRKQRQRPLGRSRSLGSLNENTLPYKPDSSKQSVIIKKFEDSPTSVNHPLKDSSLPSTALESQPTPLISANSIVTVS